MIAQTLDKLNPESESADIPRAEPRPDSPTPDRKRTIGQYVALAVAAFFAAETVLFFVRAIEEAGQHQANAARFLVLTVGAFLTFAAAFFAFARRIRSAGIFIFGVMLMQPALSSVARAVAAEPHADFPATAFAACVGLVLVAVVLRKRQQLSRPAV